MSAAPRSIEPAAGRPRRSNESVRTKNSQRHPASPTSPTSPRVRFSDDEPMSPTKPVKKTPSTKTTSGAAKGARVIRTFEEIDKIVPKEEWYEELECGICSHILGAPQGLVPCGHSFCGPCAWTWIKVNDNHTCPHCRVPVNESIPLIPNIVVDQIIDRKLAGLPDGKEKEGLISERASKSGDWKVLQSSIVPPKPPPTPRRTGRVMGAIDSFLDGGPNGRAARRGGRLVVEEEIVEEPNPTRRSVYAGMSLAEAARRGREDEQARRQSGGGAAGGRPTMPMRTSSNGSALEQHRQRQRESSISNGTSGEQHQHQHQHRPSLTIHTEPQHSHIEPVANVWSSAAARRSITRSRALSGRQTRWRDTGSRETPLVVESDSD